MRAVWKAIGAMLLALGASMLLPAGVSLLDGGGDAPAFVLAAGVTVAAGGALFVSFRGGGNLTLRESFVLVTVAWVASGLFGALPFWLLGAVPSYTEAFFEAVSGFTTTGATTLSAAAVAGLPAGLQLWRAFIQWIGGMGIIVLSVAILPVMQTGGFKVFQAEVPGHAKERLMPRIRETAKILWGVYLVITAAEVVLLWAGGMSPLDAVVHSFTTLATGGFSSRGGSVGEYHSLYFELVITAFMFLSGANFVLHYRALSGVRLGGYLRDEEFRFYALVVAAGVLVVGANLWWQAGLSPGKALRGALFQVVSIVTTTGYATENFGAWPVLSQFALLLLMFIGGCGGSTGGAIKQARFLLLFRSARVQLRKSVHPQAVLSVHLNGQVVGPEVLARVQAFFVLYLGVTALLVALCASYGMDMISAISAVAATVGNVGPGLGLVGPALDYGALPVVVKWALSAGMIVGRLEVFTVLVILSPVFWTRWG